MQDQLTSGMAGAVGGVDGALALWLIAMEPRISLWRLSERTGS